MLKEFLKAHIQSQAAFVEVGYAQVEPNHLSAQRTGQIYAQLPADENIAILEQGQFVKYDYANGLVNFTGEGEWMLVYNETKLYREHQWDCEFAMIKDNYGARVYSPLDGEKMQEMYGPTRFLQGERKWYNNETGEFDKLDEVAFDPVTGKVVTDGSVKPADYSVASTVADYWEMNDIHSGEDEVRRTLFMKLRDYQEKMMPEGTTMVPRVFKTNVGDIYTTNCVNVAEPALGDMLAPAADGYLAAAGDDAAMKWQVVKVYTLADRQKAVKIMRVA
jgi:hypothetical protein